MIHGAIEVGVDETLEDAKQNIEAIAQLAAGQRRRVLVNITKAKNVGRDARRYYSGPECAAVTTAVALVTGSLFGRVVGNFFLGLNKPSFPLRLAARKERPPSKSPAHGRSTFRRGSRCLFSICART